MAITSEAYSPIFKRGEDMEIGVKWRKIDYKQNVFRIPANKQVAGYSFKTLVIGK
jgi:hypothetical protein